MRSGFLRGTSQRGTGNLQIRSYVAVGTKMGQWLSNLAPWEIYLIATPSIMLGAILFFRGIILLLESPNREGQ
jgi:hypothetical protein